MTKRFFFVTNIINVRFNSLGYMQKRGFEIFLIHGINISASHSYDTHSHVVTVFPN